MDRRLTAAISELRENGFVRLPEFFAPGEIEAAQAGLWDEYPRPEEYFANPGQFPQYAADQFAGLRQFPYKSHALNRLAFHPRVVELAEGFLESSDLELYQIDLWAKYAGAIDYAQTHHLDYGWRSIVVPRLDGWRPQISLFFLLSDVTDQDGSTRIVPPPHGRGNSLFPLHQDAGAFADVELPMTGPAGTLVVFRTDVFHRGSNFSAPGRSRFVLIAGYQQRGLPWSGGATWSEHGQRPLFREVLEQASPRRTCAVRVPTRRPRILERADVARRRPAVSGHGHEPLSGCVRTRRHRRQRLIGGLQSGLNGQ